jgi:hypothetical protein
MKSALSIVLFLLALPVTAQTWLAYNAEGRTAATPYQVAGDLVTVDLPTTARKSNRALSFLVQQTPVNLSGGVLGFELELDASEGAWFPTYTYRGVTIPTSVRLWFTSSATPYNFVKVTDANQGTYWWSNPLDIDLEDLALFGPTVLQETLTDPSRWSSALGKNGASIPAEFNAAAANSRQIGLSFGGYFFDTGCKVAGGTATLHVR